MSALDTVAPVMATEPTFADAPAPTSAPTPGSTAATEPVTASAPMTATAPPVIAPASMAAIAPASTTPALVAAPAAPVTPPLPPTSATPGAPVTRRFESAPTPAARPRTDAVDAVELARRRFEVRKPDGAPGAPGAAPGAPTQPSPAATPAPAVAAPGVARPIASAPAPARPPVLAALPPAALPAPAAVAAQPPVAPSASGPMASVRPTVPPLLLTGSGMLPPVEQLRLVLERERLELERERLELERLRLQLDGLGGAQAATADRGGGPRRGTARLGARREGSPSASVALGTGAVLVGVVLLVVGAAWVALRPAPRATPPVASAPPAPPVASPPRAPTPPPVDPRLRGRLASIEKDLAALPAEPTPRRVALARLQSEARALGQTSLRLSARADLEAVTRQIDDLLIAAVAAERVEAAARASDPVTSPPTPRPDATPQVEPEPEVEPDPAPIAGAPDDLPRPEAPARPGRIRPPPPDEQPGDSPGLVGGQTSRDAWALFVRGCQPYDRGDATELATVVADLEKLGADLPETRTMRGLLLVVRQQYTAALTELRAAGELGGERTWEGITRAAFLTKRYTEAREAAGRLNGTEGREWLQLIDGPFRGRYPAAADALETISPDGRYRVVTDLGLTTADLTALDEKLGTAPPAEREKTLARAVRTHRGLAEVADTMDKAIKAYTKLFEEQPPEVYPTVYVFSKQSDFAEFSSTLRIGDTENVLGYYMPHYRVLVFFDQPDGRRDAGRVLTQDSLEVLLHETFHQWLHLYVEDAPPWFNEGLAEYFGIGKITSSGLRYGLIPQTHPSRLDNIREAISGAYPPKPWSLEALLRASQANFMRPGQAAVNYAHAWSFVHKLGSTREGRKAIQTYFHSLRAGGAERAFRDVFARQDLNALEREWREYVGSLR